MHRQSWKVQSEESCSSISSREWRQAVLMLEETAANEQRIEEITREPSADGAGSLNVMQGEREKLRRERTNEQQRHREERALEVEVLAQLLNNRERVANEEMRRVVQVEEAARAAVARCDERDLRWREVLAGAGGPHETLLARELEATFREEDIETQTTRLALLQDAITKKEVSVRDREAVFERDLHSIMQREERLQLRENAVVSVVLNSNSAWLQDVLRREHNVLVEETVLEERVASAAADMTMQIHDMYDRTQDVLRRELEVKTMRESLRSKVAAVDESHRVITEHVKMYVVAQRALEVREADVLQAQSVIAQREKRTRDEEQQLSTQMWYVAHFKKNFPTAVPAASTIRSDDDHLSPALRDIVDIHITAADEFTLDDEEPPHAPPAAAQQPTRPRVSSKPPKTPRSGLTPRAGGAMSPRFVPSDTVGAMETVGAGSPKGDHGTGAGFSGIVKAVESQIQHSRQQSPMVKVVTPHEQFHHLVTPPLAVPYVGVTRADIPYAASVAAPPPPSPSTDNTFLRSRLLQAVVSPLPLDSPTTFASSATSHNSLPSDDDAPSRWEVQTIHGKTYYIDKDSGAMLDRAPDDVVPLDPELRKAVEEHNAALMRRREENVQLREKQVQSLVDYLKTRKVGTEAEDSKLRERLERVARLEHRVSRAVEALRQPLPSGEAPPPPPVVISQKAATPREATGMRPTRGPVGIWQHE